MENCKNCKWLEEIGCFEALCYSCTIIDQWVSHPLFFGGSKKCECYLRKIKEKRKFVYPTKEDFINYERENKQ